MSKKNTLFLLSAILCLLLSGYWLRETLQYALFWREQQQLFLLDWPSALETLSRPAGLASLFAGFCVQFFYSPTSAVLITLILLAVVTRLVRLILYTLDTSLLTFPLALLPALFLALPLYDPCCRYDLLAAYLLGLCALCHYCLSCRLAWKPRLLAGSLSVLLLCYAVGPVALLFAFSAFLYDILSRRDHARCSLLYPLLALAVGFVAVQTGAIATYGHAFTPLFYYETGETMPLFYYHLLFPLPGCLIAAAWLHRALIVRRSLPVGAVLLLFASGLYLFYAGYRKVHKPDFSDSCRYEYLAANEAWEPLTRAASANPRSGTALNYLNLALAERGILADSLFRYPQYGPNSLVFIPKDKTPDVKLARILFAMGNLAAAQNVAFNACFTDTGYNPSMLKLLLQIELMRGAYPVAGKYIALLEKSFHYGSWAISRRRFLDDDSMVRTDSLLGSGRRSLRRTDDFVLQASPMDDLYRILDANPADRGAMQYALAYLLLAKDFNHVRTFIERHYGSPALRTLPLPAQEALLFYADYYHTIDANYALELGITADELLRHREVDLAYCLSHGVTQETQDRFQAFKAAYGNNRQSPQELAGYRHTFWHYLLFVQL